MNLIPKNIHYCWFGNKPMSETIIKCLQSWKFYLPKYKLMLWNEQNFDIHSNSFTKEAYKCEKYAFVSDYVRLFVLYNYGGIYMDTDVEVLKNLDKFLKYPAFSGFENSDFIPTGIIGAQKRHPWIKRFLDYYKERSFYKENGNMDLYANVRFMTDISIKEYGLIRNNQFQILKDNVYMFPNDYFCPKVWETKELILTPNSHTIHHFEASWM